MKRKVLVVLAFAGGLMRRSKPKAPDRIVEAGPKSPRAELAVVALLLCCAACAVGFVYVYATQSLGNQTQYMGIALGLAFAFLAAALVVTGKKLVVSENLEEEYPEPDREEEQEEVAEIVEQSGSRITRKRLLGGAAGVAGTAMGTALIAPVVSFGPVFETGPLYETPWRRGRRLVDENEKPWRADDIEQAVFYTAFPEHADREHLGSPVVMVRLDPADLRLPPGREHWAPGGILAYSKICTHAGCAIALYRTPLFRPVEPKPALVCPCHYSTFDPAQGAKVLFGPAGRPLPQLPLEIDSQGFLRAGGNMSGPVGPSWGGVRSQGAR